MLHTGIDSIDKKLAPVLCVKLKDFRVLNFELPDTETCLGVAESLTILSQPGINILDNGRIEQNVLILALL